MEKDEKKELEEQEKLKGENLEKFTKKKVGRNEPCPCNSGKKYKHCHGSL